MGRSLSWTRGSMVSLLVLATLASGCAREPVPLAFEGDRCAPDPAWPPAHQEFMEELTHLVNEHRATLDLPALTRSPALERAAVWKARHIARFRYLAHADPAPPYDRSWKDRFDDCGYPRGTWAENLASADSPQEAMIRWLDSPGHRANIEHPDVLFIGVGVAPYVDAEEGFAWAQTFGDMPDPVASPSPQVTATEDGDHAGAEGSAVETPGEAADPEESQDSDSLEDFGDADEAGASDGGDGSEDGSDGSDRSGDAADGASNEPPIARPDFGRVRRGRTASFMVLSNDSDPDGDALYLTLVGGGRWGRARIDFEDGYIVYKASRRGGGKRDRIRYEIADGSGASAAGVLTISIR